MAVDGMQLYSLLTGLGDRVQKFGESQRQQQLLSDLGSAIGSGDYAGAAKKALAGGDLSSGLKLLDLGRQMTLDDEARKALGGIGGMTGGVTPNPAGSSASPNSYRDAIASIESKGSGDYSALGPVTGGDRAYGRYQVMGKNVPQWTLQALGHSLTPDQFLADPAAQDKTFDTIFGGYVQKYGNPQDAASMWFTGKPLAQGSGASDVNGMTGRGYVDRFTQALGGAKPVQVADASGAIPASAVPQDQRAALVAERERLSRIMPGSETMQRAVKQRLDAIDFRLKEGDRESWATVRPTDVGLPGDFKGVVQRDAKTGQVRVQKAGPDTQVNIDSRGESEFTKETGKGLAKRFQDLSDEGSAAAQDMAMIKELRDIGGNISTGGGAALQGWLASHGIKLGANVGQVEAYSALVDKMTPQQRVPGSGATSDYDARMFRNSLPSLINTPEGNAIIQTTLAGLAQSKIDRAVIAERAQTGEISYKDAIKELRALPSPYEAFKKVRSEFAVRQKGAEGQANQVGDLKAPPADLISEAQSALKAGKPRDAVVKKIQSLGFDPSRL